MFGNILVTALVGLMGATDGDADANVAAEEYRASCKASDDSRINCDCVADKMIEHPELVEPIKAVTGPLSYAKAPKEAKEVMNTCRK